MKLMKPCSGGMRCVPVAALVHTRPWQDSRQLQQVFTVLMACVCWKVGLLCSTAVTNDKDPCQIPQSAV